MVVLVTGAAGFIGSHVAHAYLDDDHEVLGVDSLNDAYDVRLKEHRLAGLDARDGFRFVRGDLAEPATSGGLDWRDMDQIIHLAARAGVRQSLKDPQAYVRDNMTATIHLLDAARRHDVDRMLLASTSSLYGAHNDVPFREDADTNRPLSPYAASKKGAEAMAASYSHLYGMHLPVARFFTVYGPAGRPDMSVFRFIRWILAGEPIQMYGDGTQGRDFTYVEDIARGVQAVAKASGHDVYNLGGDSPHTMLDLVETIADIVGREASIDFQPAAPADVPRTWADISKARMLGWAPRTPLREGIEKTVAWAAAHRSLVDQVELE